MKKTYIVLMLCLFLCSAGCGQSPVESHTPEPDYSALIVPPVDLDIAACIGEQDLTAILGYPMQLQGIQEEGTQAVYYSEDGICSVTVHLCNQTRAVFDAQLGATATPTVLQEGVGETAYWFEDEELKTLYDGGHAQLMVYSGGYALNVELRCEDIHEPNAYVLQIAHKVMDKLPKGNE